MSLAWHLGCRYLRKRRAAWLALGAIVLCVAVPVVVLGVMQGFLEITRRQVRANESDLTATPRAVSEGLRAGPEARAALLRQEGVLGAAPFVQAYAILTQARHAEDQRFNVPCQVDGVDWAADSALGRLPVGVLHPQPIEDLSAAAARLKPDDRGTGFLTPAWRAHLALAGLELGAGFALGPAALPPRLRPRPGVVAGRELIYSTQGLGPGSEVQLVVPNGTGGTVGKVDAELSDTIGTGILEVDRFAVIAPLPWAQRLAGLHARGQRPAMVSGWRLQAAEDAPLPPLARRLREDTGLLVHTWEQRRANVIKNWEIQRNILGLVMVAIQCIAVFVVYAVFSTLVVEKRHDIGVLLGLGARRRDIAGAFLVAGLVACLAGSLAGWALGWGVLAGLNPFAQLTGIALFPQAVMYTPEAPTSYNPLIPLFFAAVMTVIGLIAVALPAWRASRVDPIEVLRDG